LSLPLKPKEMSLPLKPEPSKPKVELTKSMSFVEEEDGVKLKIRLKGKNEPMKLKIGKV
jgi:translation initiation factor IF-3